MNMNFGKTLCCEDGSKISLIFKPTEEYQPQTATLKAKGSLICFIDNFDYSYVSSETAFKIIDVVSILDFKNYNYAVQVIMGMISTFQQKRL